MGHIGSGRRGSTVNRTGPGCRVWHNKETLERGSDPDEYMLRWEQGPAAVECPTQMGPNTAVSPFNATYRTNTVWLYSSELRGGGAMLEKHKRLRLVLAAGFQGPNTIDGRRDVQHLLTRGPK